MNEGRGRGGERTGIGVDLFGRDHRAHYLDDVVGDEKSLLQEVGRIGRIKRILYVLEAAGTDSEPPLLRR